MAVFSALLSASVPGSNLWCAERLASVSKQRQDKEEPFGPVMEIKSGHLAGRIHCVAAAWPQTDWNARDTPAEPCINHAFQELCATRKANVLPQTNVQCFISAKAVSHPQIAAACIQASTGRADLRGRLAPSVTQCNVCSALDFRLSEDDLWDTVKGSRIFLLKSKLVFVKVFPPLCSKLCV